MKIDDFEYSLPAELIAQTPAEKRENSRMLVADRRRQIFRDDYFYNFPQLLNPGDLLVLNNTRVFPARLSGTSETGAKIELFLVRKIGEPQVWETLARPARRLKTGKRIDFGEQLRAEVLEKKAAGRVVAGFTIAGGGDFDTLVDRIGKTPLPPYIRREDERPEETDRERYQTVYASKRGAIAAPTAGLHFTPELLEDIRNRDVQIVEITLHVGYGTFEPVRVEDLSQHRVMAEEFEISAPAATLLNEARKDEDRRIIAVGTTTTRALESSLAETDRIAAGRQTARLTITPGYHFRAIDGLLTNFHLPRSSLLVLVSTFGGHQFIMDAYRHAVRERYRFYSYGDCMVIL